MENSTFRPSICAALFLAAVWSLPAQEISDNYFDMSLEQLLDVPIISASRMEQKSTQLAIPVGVITADEIHASGLTTLPEILQLLPGVDVRRFNRSHYIVGVRGMSSFTSDRTLVLIDGRNAMDPTFGAPDWLTLPVMIEDIERIEVLRGPGGAAWGANAFTGVINIITKKPDNNLQSIWSTSITEFGDSYSHIRLAQSKGKWSWRLSAGYESIEDSDAAGAGHTVSAFSELNFLMGFDSYKARDFSRTGRFDSVFHYRYSDLTDISFGAAWSGMETGDSESVGRYPMKDALSNMTRLFARVDHEFEDGSAGWLQWYGNYAVSHQPHITSRFASYDNYLEGQYTMPLTLDHSLTVGTNLRWTHLTSDNDAAAGEIMFRRGAYDEYWAGLFAIDRIKLSSRLSLENQIRLDRYSRTHSDWSLRSSVLYALDDNQEHVLRAGLGRAFRAAGVMVREASLTGLGGLFNVVRPSEKLTNESTYALEAGYTGKLSDHLTVQVNSYYQRMEDLIGSVNEYFGPIAVTHFDNIAGANTYGAETELAWKSRKFHVSGWYAYNEFVTDDNEQAIRAYFPARHKAGLRTRYWMDDGWSLNVNYIYNDAIHTNAANSPSDGTAMFHRLDINVARAFAGQRGEIMVGVADVLNATREPVYDVNSFTSYETPGRMFFVRFQYKF
ncbi:MAG: TonB-dependent receptor plug domain-containing protein [Phycisphaerae bacterium]|nr:TonB-dependent receptor plug domain-containing protein [Phycisphaerae bacterium]